MGMLAKGRPVWDARDKAVQTGVTINGLPIPVAGA